MIVAEKAREYKQKMSNKACLDARLVYLGIDRDIKSAIEQYENRIYIESLSLVLIDRLEELGYIIVYAEATSGIFVSWGEK